MEPQISNSLSLRLVENIGHATWLLGNSRTRPVIPKLAGVFPAFFERKTGTSHPEPIDDGV